MIYESNGYLVGNAGKLHWLPAIIKYIEALKINIDKEHYSFTYGNQGTIFSGVCEKIGNLLLELGKFYKKEYKLYKAKASLNNTISLIEEAIKYFKISVTTHYINECKKILKKILNNESLKKLHESLGDFFLKLDFPIKASCHFDKARSLAKPEEKKDLLEKAINAKQIDPKTNTAFLKAMYEKGRAEDLSIFNNKDQGQAFLIYTKNLVISIINPKYQDPYEAPIPSVPEQPQLPSQLQSSQIPPEPSPVNMPPRRLENENNRQQPERTINNNIQTSGSNHSQLDSTENENVALVQNLTLDTVISDLQFSILVGNNSVLQGVAPPPPYDHADVIL